LIAKNNLKESEILEIIKTTDLTKKFNDFCAVDHVSFSVKKGEIFGFLGPNGAGKTTTIKMLTTLLYPTEGSAELSGFDVIKKRDDVRQNIGVVFQEPALDTELTGEENLDFHARMYGLTGEERKNRIADVLQLVDLIEKKDVLVKNYSGGMKRRLEIARGLMHYPTVLFLDEPTLGLDSQTRRAIWDYIKRMNKNEHTTIFLTTHYMDEADYLCDRVAIIDHGKILVLDAITTLKSSVGNDVITLNSSNNAVLCDKIEKESWVKSTKHHDQFVTIGTHKGEERIPVIFDIASSINVKIKSISVRKPTLDDVFLYFTGRSIREQEPENPMKEMMKVRRRR
jgi:ABC-2 type transport system ATP-binding protein